MLSESVLDLGEMLYQLRAALDGSVYDAAVLETRLDPPPNHWILQFPLCNSAKSFGAATRQIERCRTIVDRQLVGSVQPYNAPDLRPEWLVFNVNRALRMLNDWARKDRHRKLHVIGSWAWNARPMLRLPKGISLANLTVNSNGFLEGKSEIATFKIDGYSPEMNVAVNPNLLIDVAVKEADPPCSDNDTLANRLTAMMNAVMFVIHSFETSFGIISSPNTE